MLAPSKMRRVLGIFRNYEADIPIGCVMCFLYIMENPGSSSSTIHTALGLTKQSGNRNLSNLTHRARPGKEGINVCRKEEDDRDYRVRRWFLNQRGEELKARIKDILEE